VLPRGRAWFDRFLKGIPNGIDTGSTVELAPDPWRGRTFSYAGLPATRTLRLSFPGRRSIGARGKVARTRPLPRSRQETFGAPVVRVRLSSTSGWNQLVAVLSAVTPQGRELVVSAGGARTRLTRRPRTIPIRLLSQVTAIPARSRLRLTLAATSTAQSPGNLLYLTSNVPSSARLSIGPATVTLPVLSRPVSK
jgi:predicted acyl esterase